VTASGNSSVAEVELPIAGENCHRRSFGLRTAPKERTPSGVKSLPMLGVDPAMMDRYVDCTDY
jgi:hypothetical protein